MEVGVPTISVGNTTISEVVTSEEVVTTTSEELMKSVYPWTVRVVQMVERVSPIGPKKMLVLIHN